MEKPRVYKFKIFSDKRGYFNEIYLKKKININFKFSAISYSKKNVIRGLHYQIIKPQGKYITLLKGHALDVAVNINKKNKNFGKIYKFILTPGIGVYIPPGYAHGIGFYDDENILLYHMTEYRYSKYEKGISYNDRSLKINWHIQNPILSLRDKNHPPFKL